MVAGSPWRATVPTSCYQKMKFTLMKLSAKDLVLFMSLDLLFRWFPLHLLYHFRIIHEKDRTHKSNLLIFVVNLL